MMNELRMQRPKIRGVADIAFCIDFSPSMSSCIEGVKNHISTFVEYLEKSDPNKSIDWRIAFVGYNAKQFNVFPFTKDPELFVRKLGEVKIKMADEYTAGAMDYCISELEWRKVANKFLVVFTDEALKRGWTDGGRVETLFPEFLQKLGKSGIWLFFWGPDCSYYSQFKSYTRGSVSIINDRFANVRFAELFSFLGKTVSNATAQEQMGLSKLSLTFNLDHTRIHKM